MLLMAFSNKLGYIVLSTGNKSEIAMGYCTLYGDLAGGLAAIAARIGEMLDLVIVFAIADHLELRVADRLIAVLRRRRRSRRAPHSGAI